MEVSPEKKEQEPITDGQCIEAMKAENFELVRAWYSQQQEITEKLGHEGRLDLTIQMASLQLESGLPDFARDTLDSLFQAGATMTSEQEETVRQLQAKLA